MSNTALAPSSSPSTRLPSRRAVVAVLLPLVYALFGITWMSMVPLMPEVTSALGVEKKDGTLLITIISMAKSIVPILAGILATRFGLTRMMRMAALLILVGGVAPWLSGYGAAVAARFVFGVGGAVWVTLMGSVVLAALSPAQRPVANAVNGIAVNLGVVAALFFTLPVSHVLGDAFGAELGPKLALTFGSAVTAVCLVVLVVVGDLGPTRAPTSSASSVSSTSSSGARPSVASLARAYAGVLAVPSTWILALAFCGPLALYLVLNTFLGTHLEAQFHIARVDSMRWLSFMNLWGVPASLGAGLLLSKVHPSPRPYLVVASVLVPLAVAGAVAVDDPMLRAVCFACAGFGLFLPTSPLVTAVQKLPGQTPEKLGMVFGTMFAVTYLASAAVPTLVGDVVARGVPLGTALSCAALLGATPLAGLWLARET